MRRAPRRVDWQGSHHSQEAGEFVREEWLLVGEYVEVSQLALA